MPGTNKREAAYAQARAELMGRMLDEYVFELERHDRGERVAEMVRELQERYPELDEPMRGMLMEEGLTRTEDDARTLQASHPEHGHE